jgi:hypothetical protein
MNWLELLYKAWQRYMVVYDQRAEPGVFTVRLAALLRHIGRSLNPGRRFTDLYAPADTTVEYPTQPWELGPTYREPLFDTKVVSIFGARCQRLPDAASKLYRESGLELPEGKRDIVLAVFEDADPILGAF